MLQEFILRKMLMAQINKLNLPKDKQDKIVNAVVKNPEFFKKMAEEMQSEMKSGLSQMEVAQKLAGKYQGEIKKILEE
jgi:polyhydroxyalkanoate synthesis regulator phasin